MRAALLKARTAAPVAVIVCALLASSGCKNTLYNVKAPSVFFKVKPSDATQPMTPTASVDLGSLSIKAAPLLTDEESQELFESNLQLAGLLPVRFEMTHNGGTPIELRRLKIHLHDASGGDWKLLTFKQAISRILKFNGVSLYNPSSRQTFEKEFKAYEFDLKSPLTHEEGRRQGLIIFLSPHKDPVASPKNLVLTIDGLAQPVELKLN